MNDISAPFLASNLLCDAACQGDIPKMLDLIAIGSDVNEESGHSTPLKAALFHRQHDAAVTLINHGAKIDYSDLTAAIGFIDELVPLLIELGAAINPPRRRIVTPLMAAAESENSEILHLLLSQGANIHARDYHNRTALFFAADSGRAGNARILIAHGVEINARNRRNNTALQIAMRNAKSSLNTMFHFDEFIEVLTKAGGVT